MITLIPGGQSDRQPSPPASAEAESSVRHYRLGAPAPDSKKTGDAGSPRPELPACGGMSAKEKARICQAANAAYKHLRDTGRLDMEFPAEAELSESKRMETWRRAVLLANFGLTSLTLASHQQFNEIRSHFDSMVPQRAGRAYRGLIRGDGDENKKRIALHKIREACQAAKLDFPGYPLAIAFTQFKVRALDDLKPKQAWALFFTMTGRSKRHRPAPKPQANNSGSADSDPDPF